MSKVLTQADPIWPPDRCEICGWPYGRACTPTSCSQRPVPTITAKQRLLSGLIEDRRSRLERAVINAAKAWNRTNYRDVAKCEELLSKLGDTVDALIAFESSQAEKSE